jgi:hypothetical protein
VALLCIQSLLRNINSASFFVGAVDGTLIPIQGPSQDEAAYVCRKGFHALNVQAVVDAEMRYTILCQTFKSCVKLQKNYKIESNLVS